MSFTFQAVLGTIAVVWEVKKNFVLLLGGKSFYLTYGKGFKRGAAYLHFFFTMLSWLCGSEVRFQKWFSEGYTLPLLPPHFFQVVADIEDK